MLGIQYLIIIGYYAAGQPHYTMLYKEKKNLNTGKITVQYDRLTPKDQP